MLRQSLMGELQFEANNTRKLFDAIPDDVLDYKPNDFNWTLAELASHIAETYNWWVPTLNQPVFEMDKYTYDRGDISSMEFLKKKLEENIALAIDCLTGYPEEKFMEIWTMTSHGKELLPPMPRIQVMRSFLFNHLYHHRGEMVAYLRANGKPVPGLYGPSYEETLAAQTV
ncbi:MAG: DinB family protein [Bacteroidota bacterium]